MNKFRQLVGEVIGEASMCWSETPLGVFDSTRASALVDKICAHVDRREELEIMLYVYTEMRPLLHEWDKLNVESAGEWDFELFLKDKSEETKKIGREIMVILKKMDDLGEIDSEVEFHLEEK